MTHIRSFAVVAVVTLVFAHVASARSPDADGATRADAERAVQAYLAMWSHDEGISAAAITKFYAPRIVYFGKVMSRSQVLADKLAYIRQWPVRQYREVPGSFSAHCNKDRSLCQVSAEMTWRRISRSDHVSTGRARLTFEFVPADGGRKIARESARLL